MTRPGRFGNQTEGRIPKNVLRRGHRCADAIRYCNDARAAFPSAPSDLVVDPFAGRVSTGMAAEALGRRWIAKEKVLQYLQGAAPRFTGCDGYAGSRLIEARAA